MALDNCSNCPNYCFGNVTLSDCVEYNGESLKGYLDGLSIAEAPAEVSGSVTTDSITSKSQVRNPGSVCGSQILNRTYKYTLNTSQTGSTFGWNLLDIISALPSGYDASAVRVKISGQTTNGRNIISDSKKQSGGVNIKVNQYPVTIDLLIRVTSPCGDIDMESTLIIQGPSKVGEFSAVMRVMDLNPASGEIVLTEQLDGLEAQVYDLSVRVNSMPDQTIVLEQQQAQIDDLSDSINDASTLLINYETQGSTFTNDIGGIITTLYSEIESLKTTVTSQEVEISTLRAQIDSINAAS